MLKEKTLSSVFMGLMVMAAGLLLVALPVAAQTTNPYLQQVEDKAKELAADLNRQQAEDLGEIRDLYGLIRSVAMVRRNVSDAVAQCGRDNPAMKAAMDERFGRWSETVTAALAEQEAHYEAAVTAERFDNPQAVRDYLALLDRAAEYAEEQIDKQIVTTPEACESLRSSMDEAEAHISRLLGNMEWPE